MSLYYQAKAVLRRQVPESWFFTLMRIFGGANWAEADPDQLLEDWQGHLDRAGASLHDSRVLEVGSGRFARFAVRLLRAGAVRVTLVDPNAHPLEEPAHERLLADDAVASAFDPAQLAARLRVMPADITTLAPPAPADAFDLAISNAVLEHAREPLRLLQACHEWLRPGGRTVHLVDLRDHAFDWPFEMLTFSERQWHRWYDPPGSFHLNRWRLEDYRDAMTAAGFVDVATFAVTRDPAGLEAVLPRLDPKFQAYDPETLATCTALVHGRKPEP